MLPLAIILLEKDRSFEQIDMVVMEAPDHRDVEGFIALAFRMDGWIDRRINKLMDCYCLAYFTMTSYWDIIAQ